MTSAVAGRPARRRRGAAGALTLAVGLALLPSPAGAQAGPHAAGGGDAPSTAAGATSPTDDAPVADGAARLLVTVEDPDDLDAVREALDPLGPVTDLAPRVLAVVAERGRVGEAVGAWEATVEANAALAAASRPDDEYFAQQWGLENTGQPMPHGSSGTEGRAGLDVGALGAWRHTRGSRDVTVALVDTEVEPHPDLEANLLPGRSFAPAQPCPSPVASHGTEVAGVAAAVRDNGAGISGLAPRVRILPVDFLDSCGFGDLEGAVAAITWAARNGADVIMASFASAGSTPEGEARALRTAIEDAGVPVIAAAGNSGRDLSANDAPPVYPASFNLRNQLAVAAVDNTGELPIYSNHGRRHVQLAAPGDTIYTTMVEPTGTFGYGYADGTSYAVPHVAGAVALAIGLRPVLTSEAILDLTVDTTRSLSALQGRVGSGGMLDAGALVAAVADGGACPTTRVPDSGFRDVPAGGIHTLGVDCIAWWDVTRGRTATAYEPRASITRGQMATFLAKVVEAGPGLPSDPPRAFPDVAGSVHERPINALAALGVVRGHGDGTYRPSAPVTRAQMASFLVNTYEHLVGDAPSPSGTWFRDVEGSVHADAAESLWELGLTAGTATRTYDPHPAVRRDQMGSFVARLLDRVVREDAVAAR